MAATRKNVDKSPSTPIDWDPKTKLGKMVLKGEITTMSDALKTGLPIREPEIVDILLPAINDEVIDVNMVQRMTDSGRRVKFVITVAVGNNDGFIGFGQAKGKEVGSSIRKAIESAKLNVIEIKRGCGSWECGCRKPHTVPFTVKGKTKTTVNYAKAVFNALEKNAEMRIMRAAISKVGIKSGSIEPGGEKQPVEPMPEEAA